MVETQVPFMFRGQTRFYRVIGVQGHTCYGLNVDVVAGLDKKLSMTLALACLNDPPPGSPFKGRNAGQFLVAFEENPPPGTKPLFHPGHRLNKVKVDLGENLSSFEASAYLEQQVPALRSWLDKTLEDAGIMPTFNDTSEVFRFFFGESKQSDAKYFPLQLPDLGKWSDVTVSDEMDPAPAFDFSQYGKDKQIPGATYNPKTGEIGPLHEKEFEAAVKKSLADKGLLPKDDASVNLYHVYLDECQANGHEPMLYPDWLNTITPQDGKPAIDSPEATAAYEEYANGQSDDGEDAEPLGDWYATWDWNNSNKEDDNDD